MVEKTILALPSGRKASVPRPFKRTLEIALSVTLTSAIFLVMIVGNGVLIGRGASLQAGLNAWLDFIKRPDILGTMTITAVVTVFLVYRMRDRGPK